LKKGKKFSIEIDVTKNPRPFTIRIYEEDEKLSNVFTGHSTYEGTITREEVSKILSILFKGTKKEESHEGI